MTHLFALEGETELLESEYFLAKLSVKTQSVFTDSPRCPREAHGSKWLD